MQTIFFTKKVQENLRISKKSSNFARFFALTILVRAPKLRFCGKYQEVIALPNDENLRGPCLTGKHENTVLIANLGSESQATRWTVKMSVGLAKNKQN